MPQVIIRQAIARQLSGSDRRLLLNREAYLTEIGVSTGGYEIPGCNFDVDGHEISDGGFNAEVIIQAIDVSLAREAAALRWCR